MPGISIVYKKALSQNLINKEKVHKCAKKALFSDDYFIEDIWDSNEIIALKTAYKTYPVQIINNESVSIIFEGLIYNKENEEIKTELLSVAKNLISNNGSHTEGLSQFIKSTDGEYIVYIFDNKVKCLFIFNDGLGRLPFYIMHEGDFISISREIRFLLSFTESMSVDMAGLSQAFLIGFPLGENTYYSNIKKIPPCSLVIIDDTQKKPKWKQIFTLNLDSIQTVTKLEDKVVIRLVDLFLQACKNRAKTHTTNILSLSGGLDSRAVAAALTHSECDYQALTFLDYPKRAFRDVQIAKRIARICNITWNVHKLQPVTKSMMRQIFAMKAGMVPPDISDFLQFEESIVNKYQRLSCGFSGDGGDKALPNLFVEYQIPDEQVFFRNLLDYQSFTKLGFDFTSRATGLSQKKIADFVLEIISQYPEKSWEGKYLHYIIYERGLKFMLEGPDRVRYFHWAHCPFYSLPFFEYAMSCSQEIKKDYVLYRKFLNGLSPKIANLAYNSLKRKYNSPAKNVYVFLLYYIPEQMRKRMPRLLYFFGLKENRILSLKQTLVKKQIDNCEEVRLLHHRIMKDKDPSYLPESMLDVFLHVYGILEEIYSDNPVLNSKAAL